MRPEPTYLPPPPRTPWPWRALRLLGALVIALAVVALGVAALWVLQALSEPGGMVGARLPW